MPVSPASGRAHVRSSRTLMAITLLALVASLVMNPTGAFAVDPEPTPQESLAPSGTPAPSEMPAPSETPMASPMLTPQPTATPRPTDEPPMESPQPSETASANPTPTAQPSPTPPPTTTGGLTGIATDQGGAPLVGLLVELCEEGSCTLGITDETDTDGRYVFENLVNRDYRVVVYPDGISGRRVVGGVQIGASVDTLDFSLPSGGLVGSVTRADGTVPDGLWVQVCGPEENGPILLHDCHAALVDATGQYELPMLIDGVWEVMLMIPSDAYQQPRVYGTIGISGGTETWSLTLPSGGLTGSVTLPDGGPAADTSMELCGGTLAACIGASTTADGIYEFPYLDPGSYVVRAQPPYGRDDLRAVTADVEVEDVTASADLQLVYGASLSGFVRGPGGEPVPDLSVAAFDGGSGWSAVTDATGWYSIQLPEDGTYWIEAYPPSDSPYDVTTVTDIAVLGPTNQDIVLNLKPTGAWTGILYDFGGVDPQPGTVVRLCAPGEAIDACSRAMYTDADGRFLFSYLPPGDYRLVVEDPVTLVLTEIGSGTVAESTLEQDANLPERPGGGILGHVYDAGSQPVVGAEVYVSWGSGSLYRITDDGGAFTITGLPPGTYWLDVYPPAPYAPTNLVVTVADEPVAVDVVLDPVPTGGLEGAVTTSDGDPVPDATLQLCTLSWDCRYGFTDASGGYAIGGMPAGAYRATIYPSYGDSYEHPDWILVDDLVVTQNFQLPPVPVGQVVGTVATADGTPYGDTNIFACGPGGCRWGYVESSGTYTISGLAPGTYDVNVWVGSSYRVGGSVTVNDDVVTHHIVLPSGEIHGTVIDGTDSAAIGHAWVVACDALGNCHGDAADDGGTYSIGNLPDGTYQMTVYPPSSAHVVTRSDVTVAVSGGSSARDLVVERIQLPPETVTMTGPGTAGSTGGTPVLYAGRPIELRIEACAEATGATYEVVSLYDSTQSVTGPMTDDGSGSRTFIATLELPFAGAAEVHIFVDGCGAPIEFNVYIDPSGYVRNSLGEPIVGATVVLYRSDTPTGPWQPVADGSEIMSPSNRTNPDLTDETGHFGWDVVAGYYRVETFKSGCVSAEDHAMTAAVTRVYEIPPPVFDIDLRLYCGEETPSDGEAPVVTISTPATDGATLVMGDHVAYACTDNTAVISCAASVDGVALGTTASGTETIGSHVLEVVATDAAGNSTTLSRGYSVIYDFSGFFAPIDNPLPDGTAVFNRVKAGAGVPIKFSLDGDQGLSVLGLGSPTNVVVPCDGSVPSALVEETISVKASALSYDATADQYVLAFKTDKKWAGTCRILMVRLADGTTHRIYFEFR